jgi:hypothetical protein
VRGGEIDDLGSVQEKLSERASVDILVHYTETESFIEVT